MNEKIIHKMKEATEILKNIIYKNVQSTFASFAIKMLGCIRQKTIWKIIAICLFQLLMYIKIKPLVQFINVLFVFPTCGP